MYPRSLSISSVGQITLPKSIRELLGVQPGAKLDLVVNEKDNTITLRRQKTIQEVSAELERIHAKYNSKPDPRTRYMTVGEMSIAAGKEMAWSEENKDTWV